jgi:NADH:ubiquinone oxidoreductase subunit 4 (subunit M)
MKLDKGEFYGLIILAVLVIGLGLFPQVLVQFIANNIG